MIFNKLFSAFSPKPDQKHIKILVIEDSPVDMKVIANAVLRGGYSVLQASDGKSGMEMARTYLPQLIILDYNLPDTNGPQVCKIFKADERTKDIPVLFLTGVDSPGSIINCYEQGGENYLAKPVNARFLLKQIELILADRKL